MQDEDGERRVRRAAETLAAETRGLLVDIEARLIPLAERTAHWWLQHGVDREDGGFYGTLTRDGSPTAPHEKGLIQQARHLWAMSMWHGRRVATVEVEAAAASCYAFLLEHLRDEKDGEFFFMAGPAGGVADRMKKLYAEAFAIYGLSAYASEFDVPAARQHALDCFASIDARAHDSTHGGYDQTDDPLSWIDGAAHGTNTHIHLMEALTALYELTRDPVVRERLGELVDVTVHHLLQPSDYVALRFDRAWTPVGSPLVSYGHDIETVWLLLDAARALGRAEEPAVRDASRRMGVHASEGGYDADSGGYYNEGVPGGEVTDPEKIWWVQFEALAGLWWLFRLTGDVVHLRRLDRTLARLEATWDPVGGEWFYGHLPDGTPGPRGENKGEEWKTSYHNLRALVFTRDWIEEALRE
jgi:mannobiose 2-epimerase